MKKGYTLVEILTGVSIFLLVVLAANELLVSAFRAQKKALAVREIVDSASFAMEYMTRAIRMAKKSGIQIRGNSTSCFEGTQKNYGVFNQGRQITFRTYKLNECQSFLLEAGIIKEEKAGVKVNLTPQQLEVTTLKFFVQGDTDDDPANERQPRVTIFFEIQKRGQPETKISLQTTVSQRDLDF